MTSSYLTTDQDWDTHVISHISSNHRIRMRATLSAKSTGGFSDGSKWRVTGGVMYMDQQRQVNKIQRTLPVMKTHATLKPVLEGGRDKYALKVSVCFIKLIHAADYLLMSQAH